MSFHYKPFSVVLFLNFVHVFPLINSFQKVITTILLLLVFTTAANYLGNNNDGKGLSNLGF